MKTVKAHVLPFVAAMLLLFLSSCGGSGIKVTLDLGKGAKVLSSKSVSVNPGESAVFTLSMDEGYVYIGNDAGAEYNPSTGALTLTNVFESKKISVFTANEADCIRLSLYSNLQNCEVYNSAGSEYVTEAQEVTLGCKYSKSQKFLGWSKGGFIADGGEMVSELEEYSFNLSENTSLYANFSDWNAYTIIYHANGGKVSDTGNETYTVNGTFTEMYSMQQTMESNGVFVRDGYVAVGYSTSPADYESKQDVNHIEGFSNMGGVCEAGDGGILNLYVVWAKESPASDFTVSGGRITAYKGSDKIVVIPQKINGKAITAVNSKAFNGSSVERLVLPKNVVEVEDEAVFNCQNLREVVFFDSMLKIGDKSFSKSLGKMSVYCLNASHLPKHSGTREGSFCIKYERLRTLKGKKAVFVAGSSMLYGLDSERFMNQVPGYEVVNYGTNGSCNAMAFLEVISKYTSEGDLIIHAPEMWSGGQIGSNSMTWEMFRSNEQCYDFFRDLDATHYTDMFNAYYWFTTGYPAYEMTPAITLDEKPYQLPETDMNKYGDITYEYDRTSYDVLGPSSTLSGLNIKKQNLKIVYDMIKAKGGIPLYSFCTFNFARMSMAYDSSGNPVLKKTAMSPENVEKFNKNCEDYNQYCIDNLGIDVISDVADYIMDSRYFSNSDYHCTTKGSRCGREVRTDLLARDIKAYLAK